MRDFDQILILVYGFRVPYSLSISRRNIEN